MPYPGQPTDPKAMSLTELALSAIDLAETMGQQGAGFLRHRLNEVRTELFRRLQDLEAMDLELDPALAEKFHALLAGTDDRLEWDTKTMAADLVLDEPVPGPGI